MGRWDKFWESVHDERPKRDPYGSGSSAAERATKVYTHGERASYKEDSTGWSLWKELRHVGDARSTYSTEKIIDDDLFRENLRRDREREADESRALATETRAFEDAFERFRGASSHDFAWRADFGWREFWNDHAFLQSAEYERGEPPQYAHLGLTPREDKSSLNERLHFPLSTFRTQELYPSQVLRLNPNRGFVSMRAAFAFTIWHRSDLGPKDPETVNIVIEPGQSVEQAFAAFPVTSRTERFEVHATFQAEDEGGNRGDNPRASANRLVGNNPITPFWDHAYWEIRVSPEAEPVRLDLITNEAILGLAIRYREMVSPQSRARVSEQFTQWLHELMTTAEARARQVGCSSLAHSVVPLEFDTRHFRFLKQGPVRPLTEAEERHRRFMESPRGRIPWKPPLTPAELRQREQTKANELAARVARDGVFWWRKVEGVREVWVHDTDAWKAPAESIRLQEPNLPGFVQPPAPQATPAPASPPVLSPPRGDAAGAAPTSRTVRQGPVTVGRVLIGLYLLLFVFKFKVALVLAIPIGLVWAIVYFGKQAISERSHRRT